MSRPSISIIIPCKTKKDLCSQLLPALKAQTFKSFETLIITDKILKKGPADKRDFAAKKAQSPILAFIDSDAYPHKNWLKNALSHFKDKNIAAVCGPGLTPPSNNLFQQVSGLVWSTRLGAGPYTYRNRLEPTRFVDDYPTFNLLIRKKDFQSINGFNSNFWPGEDTKLCHDLVYKLKKKIIYNPKVKVFHHRRPIFIPHLKQISRYGLHRGYFTKILPKTSKRLGYFIPLFFLIGLIFFPYLTLPPYFLLLFLTSFKHRSLLLIPAIFLTHLTYSLMFLKGLLTKNLLH